MEFILQNFNILEMDHTFFKNEAKITQKNERAEIKNFQNIGSSKTAQKTRNMQ